MKTIDLLKTIAADMVRQRLQGSPSSIEVELADRGSLFFPDKWWEKDSAHTEATRALINESEYFRIVGGLLDLCIEMGRIIRALDLRGVHVRHWLYGDRLGQPGIADERYLRADKLLDELMEFEIEALAKMLVTAFGDMLDEHLRSQ